MNTSKLVGVTKSGARLVLPLLTAKRRIPAGKLPDDAYWSAPALIGEKLDRPYAGFDIIEAPSLSLEKPNSPDCDHSAVMRKRASAQF